MDPIRISRELARQVGKLRFAPPVTHVYNPLDYARESHETYLERYTVAGCQAILIGMNPGPFGMAQTGVPFGEVAIVREWLGIETAVSKPRNEHPKRPVQGFECTRSEISGQRLWGWARKRFKTPKAFAQHFFIWNYCPLVFMEESGRNRTPDKLPKEERAKLFGVCDRAMKRMVAYIKPEYVIGVGKFAEARAASVMNGEEVKLGGVLHPSPASPIANRGWSAQAEKQLRALGIRI